MLRWLTFSAMSVLALTASAAEDVVLELPADYKVMTPDDMLRQHRSPSGAPGP